jgi:hypothetical protein
VRWETGNGVKFGLKRSANKACGAGAAEGQIYRFRPLFLWFISFGGAKEMNKNFQSKEPNKVSSVKQNEQDFLSLR